jgi:two-component system heavy metal sensor histidine kinase CusS
MRRWSIARRVVLIHIVAVLLSTVAILTGLYLEDAKSIERASSRELLEEISAINTLLRTVNSTEMLAHDVMMRSHDPDSLIPLIRIIDRNGRIVLESPEMVGFLPVAAFPPPGREAHGKKWHGGDGKEYLLKSSLLPDDLLSVRGGVLQLAMDLGAAKVLGSGYPLSLAFCIGGGILLAILSAMVIVHLGLKPLAEISAVIQRVSTSQLRTRIETTALPLELVSLADSFNKLLDRMEGAITRLSHYTANLAHELRTPINNLMIEADVALSQTRTPEEYQKVIGSNLDEYMRLTWMIDRLLFLARADSAQEELVREELDASTEIEDVVDFFADTAYDARIELSCHGEALLRAEPELFRRAVSNLVANALKYTPRGGRVTVAVRQEDDLAVEVAVSDTGCGIDGEHLPCIFDRFYRVDDNRQMDPTGSGLGLAIVKAIMTLHGGTIDIQSEVGKGTTVTLKFLPPFSVTA